MVGHSRPSEAELSPGATEGALELQLSPRKRGRPRKPDTEATIVNREVLRQFWVDKGLKSPTQIARLVELSKNHALHRDPARVDARLEELRERLPQLDVVRIVGLAPALLSFLPTTLEQKMRLLPEALGVTPEEATAIINASPTLLQHTPQSLREKQESMSRRLPALAAIRDRPSNSRLLTRDVEGMVERGRLLQELLPGVNLDKVLKHHHNLLTVSEATMRERVELLTPTFGRASLAKIVSSAPNILNMRPQTILSNLEQLKKLVPNLNLRTMLGAVPALMSCSPSSLAEKFRILEELLPGQSVPKLVSQQPRLLGLQASTIRAKFSFLAETFGSQQAVSMVGRTDRLLSYGRPLLELRLQQWRELLPGVDTLAWLVDRPQMLTVKFESVAPRLLLLQHSLGYSREEVLELLVRHGSVVSYRTERYLRLYYMRLAIPYGQKGYAISSVVKATPHAFEEMCGEQYSLFLSSALQHLRQKGSSDASGAPPEQPPTSPASPAIPAKAEAGGISAMERLVGDTFSKEWQALGGDVSAAERLWEGYRLPQWVGPIPKTRPADLDCATARAATAGPVTATSGEKPHTEGSLQPSREQTAQRGLLVEGRTPSLAAARPGERRGQGTDSGTNVLSVQRFSSAAVEGQAAEHHADLVAIRPSAETAGMWSMGTTAHV